MAIGRGSARLDMDAFFTSIELLPYPQLKGLPFVISGRPRKEDNVPSSDEQGWVTLAQHIQHWRVTCGRTP
jgi:hypothetical protein